jgi:hypothetical protein
VHETDVATGPPVWVWPLLVALVLLGVRRLRMREVPLVAALLPPAIFLGWSAMGLASFAGRVGFAWAATAWLAGAALGAASTALVAEPRGERLPGGRVRQYGSAVPLALYMAVFVIRFVCGAWEALRPEHADLATGIGIASGAAVMARLVVGVLRWRTVPSTA